MVLQKQERAIQLGAQIQAVRAELRRLEAEMASLVGEEGLGGRRLTISERIINFMSQYPGQALPAALIVKKLAGETGGTTTGIPIYVSLMRLAERGVITKVGRGQYAYPHRPQRLLRIVSIPK